MTPESSSDFNRRNAGDHVIGQLTASATPAFSAADFILSASLRLGAIGFSVTT